MPNAAYRGMPYRRMGPSGLCVSEIGLGLWKWGDPSYDGSRIEDHEGFQVLDRALELGVFHWDTACSYNLGSGNSERLLGRYFVSRDRSVREHVILATKIHNPVRDEHVMEAEFNPNHRGSSRGYIRFAVDKCLQRLRTDYIDLLYLHTAPVDEEGNYTAPPEETWGAMDDLVTQGKVRYLGVSNHSSRQMGDVADALDRVGKDPSRRIVAVQNRYSLLERDRVASEEGGKEGPFLRAAEKAGAGVVPFYPLASGALTGRYRRENLDTVTGRIIDDGAADEWLTERNLNILEALAGLVQEKGITMAQLAIAWLLAQPGVASVIAGVTRMEHLEDNVKAAQVDLSEDDLKRIEGILEQEDVK